MTTEGQKAEVQVQENSTGPECQTYLIH